MDELNQIEMGTAMNTIGSWDTRKERLKRLYPLLTDEDLILDATNRDEMFDNLQHKLNITSAELHTIIISL